MAFVGEERLNLVRPTLLSSLAHALWRSSQALRKFGETPRRSDLVDMELATLLAMEIKPLQARAPRGRLAGGVVRACGVVQANRILLGVKRSV